VGLLALIEAGRSQCFFLGVFFADIEENLTWDGLWAVSRFASSAPWISCSSSYSIEFLGSGTICEGMSCEGAGSGGLVGEVMMVSL